VPAEARRLDQARLARPAVRRPVAVAPSKPSHPPAGRRGTPSLPPGAQGVRTDRRNPSAT